MAKYRVVGIRVETEEEKRQREWFEKQVLASPDHLDEAARLIIGLVTGLLGVLFGVLAIANDPLPAYLRDPNIRGLGGWSVALLLGGLLAALFVVLPWRWTFKPRVPASQAATFAAILRSKSIALTIAAILFGAGVVFLAALLIFALAKMP